MNEAMRDWVTNIDDTFYIIGTVAVLIPSDVGRFSECYRSRGARSVLRRMASCLTPWACVGGGSNAIGLFHSSRC